MTRVLYGSGLNYQSGNPIRSEIRQVERKVNDLASLFEDFKKVGGGGSASTPAVSSTEFEGRFQKFSDDIQAVQSALGSILGRIDRAEGASGDFGTRISRVESAQLGASSMVMEQRSLIDRLVARIEKLEAAAVAAAVAPAPATE
jgi:hypothetical protein